MRISIKGKQVDVGGSLREHVRIALAQVSEKYFADPLEGHVVFSRDRHLYRVEMQVHVGFGILVQAHGSAADPYDASSAAIEHLARRLQRYKGRLRDHDHKSIRDESVSVPYYTLQMPSDGTEESKDDGIGGEHENDFQPIIIAEMSVSIASLSVSDAVMRLDLGNLPVLLFRHPNHGQINVVYRRSDGNIGWIDSGGAEQTSFANK